MRANVHQTSIHHNLTVFPQSRRRGVRSTARGGSARVRAEERPGAVPRTPERGGFAERLSGRAAPHPCPGAVPRTPEARASTSLRSGGMGVAAGRRTSLRSGSESLSAVASGALAPLPPQKFGVGQRSGGGRGAAAPGQTPLPRRCPREKRQRLRRLPRGAAYSAPRNASASAQENKNRRRPSTGVTVGKLPSGRQRINSHCFCGLEEGPMTM